MSLAALSLDDIPMAEVVSPHFEEAARLLNRGIQAGCQDGNVFYLLGCAHKRQGNIDDARAAFRKVPRPSAGVSLQLGLLALEQEQYAQAEEEFARALQQDAGCYEACFNLLMTRLTLGKLNDASALAGRVAGLARSPDEQRLLGLLNLLVAVAATSPNGKLKSGPGLPVISRSEEARLLKLVRSIGEPDTVRALLAPLRTARGQSAEVQEAYFEAVLGRAVSLVERSSWLQAERLLAPHADDPDLNLVPQPVRAAFFNLLGCCACLNQDFDGGLRHFQSALESADDDARLQQNVALAQEWVAGLRRAESHWNEFLEVLDGRWPTPPEIRNYSEQLAFETLNRLSIICGEAEQWTQALAYMERAGRVRPNSPEVLERLFHLYQQNKKTAQARRALARLREISPNEPQYELYDLDFVEVKSLNDVEHMLSEIDDILRRHPGDARVEERAIAMVRNVVPLLGSLCDQLTDQMSRVIEQVRRLPHYQINWRAVHDVMRDLRREFNKLRRIASKCQSLVRNDEHRRVIRDLIEHIDRKIEVCQQMGG